MTSTMAESTAARRLAALVDAILPLGVGLSAECVDKIKAALMADPGLPRAEPTVSLWQEPRHPTMSTIQSEKLAEYTDFVVIGSGITGCSVTKSLLEHPKLKQLSRPPHVTLLEARTLVSGATSRNGGHLVSAAGHTFNDLKERYGEDNAKQITRFSIMNIDHLLEMVSKMDPEIQAASQVRTLVKVMAARDEATWKNAEASLAAFQAAVPEHSTYHRRVAAEDVDERWNIRGAYGAIEHAAGAIWPFRLLTNLCQRLVAEYADRLAIETNTPVLGITKSSADGHRQDDATTYPYLVSTPRGVIRAKHVIHCTNAFASHLLPQLRGKVYPFRGTMTVQKAGSQLPNLGDSRSWSSMTQPRFDPATELYETGLVYLQQNGHTGDIWVGTETSKLDDVLSADDTFVTKEAHEALTCFLPGFFSRGWKATESSKLKGIWTGIQGHTVDSLPLVGELPVAITGREVSGSEQSRLERGGEWIAAGFNGYGMDKCWLTGDALVKMIVGDDVSDYFPQCYIITEERLRKRMTMDMVVDKFAAVTAKR